MTLTASQTKIAETSTYSVSIWANADRPVNETVLIDLELSGNAEVDVDYELSSRVIRIPAHDTNGRVRVFPILDWDVDPGESASMRIGQLAGNLEAGQPDSLTIGLIDGPVPPNYKENISADLRVFSNLTIERDSVTFDLRVFNLGAADSSSTDLDLVLRTDLSNASTNVYSNSFSVPELAAYHSYSRSVEVPLATLPSATTLYGFAVLRRTEEEVSVSSQYGHDYLGFSLDSNRRVVTRCQSSSSPSTQTGPDPLFSDQWHLSNSGQSAFASAGGIPGADLSMESTLDAGPFGENVRVAIVDTGLEQCHPDLLNRIEANASYNFAADPSQLFPWFGAVQTDVFNPYSLGDHGTSIAGIIAATLNNGVGGRGIAPSSLIRGYNFLSSSSGSHASSLGSSTVDPDSSDVAVFNMSYGTIGSQRNPSALLTSVFLHGTTELREGLGAIYVKSAGNGFNRCLSIEHDLRSELGCRSSNSDSTNSLPYLIVAGGFNADDERASYASAGSNIWITAPAGQFGSTSPAVVTTDQQGLDRGYDVLVSRGLALDDSANDGGNYISTFNGTSSSAPMISGAVATILSENASLSWRDVKHILASTARRLDVAIPPIRIAFGGGRPHTFRHGWTLNKAGYWFHNWFGFGAVDLDAALAMARSYSTDTLGDFADSGRITTVDALSIPDFNSDGVSSSIEVTNLPSSATIEAVVVNVFGAHEFLSDLSITLVSPAGTESILNPAFNDSLVGTTDLNWQLLSNAFYGESPNGNWSLNIVDAHSDHVGELEQWSIRFYYGSK
ncbi:MAG: S8 family serine peptidase [Gammaproteobacteria bacterium]|nr:S8 family serine peptidase [Gammaproteobacteria bacterium]MYD80475.1 S8 family serine peptidase [Gammaproteobacteria bacterium]